MICRRHGSKVTFALWSMAVVALLTAGIGVLTALVLMAALAVVAGAATTVWVLTRRPAPVRVEPAAEPVVAPGVAGSRA